MANANDKSKILGVPKAQPKHQTRGVDRVDAFTFPTQGAVGGTQFRTLGGLTKREHFAGLIYQGMLAAGMRTGSRRDDAMEAVKRADALIEALNDDPDEAAEA